MYRQSKQTKFVRALLWVVSLTVLMVTSNTAWAASEPFRYLILERQSSGDIQLIQELNYLKDIRSASQSFNSITASSQVLRRGQSRIRATVRDSRGRVVFEAEPKAEDFVRSESGDPKSTRKPRKIAPFFKRKSSQYFVLRVPQVDSSQIELVDEKTGELTVITPRRNQLANKKVQAASNSVVTGPSSNRLDIVILGDGYTQAERSKFDSDFNRMVEGLRARSPLKEYVGFLNFIPIFVASQQSGADHPVCPDNSIPDPLEGRFVNTAFDATYCFGGVQRALVVNEAKVLQAAGAQYPEWDVLSVLVNDTFPGGTGGTISVTAMDDLAEEVLVHEFGHTFIQLADEYEDHVPGFPECSDFSPREPDCEPNVTDDIGTGGSFFSQTKWSRWFDTTIPLPTPEEPSFDGQIGLFQGGRYKTTGIWRPTLDSLMRSLGKPYDSIAKEEFTKRLYLGNSNGAAPLSLIDRSLPQSSNLNLASGVSQKLEVFTPSIPNLEVSWFVNGRIQPSVAKSFQFSSNVNGSYQIRALIREPAPFLHPSEDRSIVEFSKDWTVNVGTQPSVCVEGPNTLCLNQGRFRVEVKHEDFNSNQGVGKATSLTSETGYFWFFNQANIEIVVKVLNGCGLNQRFWVFAAGLTNVGVEMVVTDTLTGQSKTYQNNLGVPFQPIQDTNAFSSCNSGSNSQSTQNTVSPTAKMASSPRLAVSRKTENASSSSCTQNESTLCLNQGRFKVRTLWRDFSGGSGFGGAVQLTTDSGYFWFFNKENVEVVVKVLNGCTLNDRYWVFSGGLTNVNVELEVEDTQTGLVKRYVNPSGQAFQPIQDTNAIQSCD